MRFIFFFLILIFNVHAGEISGHYSYSNFTEAKTAPNRLGFTVESTKVGIFSSDVDGYVKVFSFKAQLDNENFIIRNIKLVLQVESMDTDFDSRDEKLHNLCMEVSKYPTIEIELLGAIYLKSVRPQNLTGRVMIRGKEKNINLTLSTILVDDYFKITGNSVWGLKQMEIPDPSIAVARLSDEIRINFSILEKI